MRDLKAVQEKLVKYGQEHLLRFYDELSDSDRRVLMEQISALDLELIGELIPTHVFNKPQARPQGLIKPPSIAPAKPADTAQQQEYRQAHQLGLKLLAEGKVAAFVVAGGQGTRLGFEGPKGCLEATPVMRKPLFQVLAEQILAAGNRSGRPIPWYVMTSPSNDVVTRAFFRQHKFFGLDPQNVFFLVQGMLPAIGLDGKILLESKGKLALSPNGHGGSLQAIRDSGALEDMARRGIELISYFQVDNPLVHAIDPLFLGLHSLRGAQMSAKALPKRDPYEKLGNFCLVDGKVTVIEYSDMPGDLAEATTEDGRLKFSAGSIAIHVLSRSFVEQLTEGGRGSLPYHRAEKKVPAIDSQGGPVESDAPNAIKLEMFVFDAMPLAKKTLILETNRREEFSPIKNREGEDSLTSSLHDQIRRAASWLEQAGISVPRDADGQIAAPIEISPLFADSAGELVGKVDKNLKIAPGQNLYLGSRGQTGGLK